MVSQVVVMLSSQQQILMCQGRWEIIFSWVILSFWGKAASSRQFPNGVGQSIIPSRQSFCFDSLETPSKCHTEIDDKENRLTLNTFFTHFPSVSHEIIVY